MRLTAYKCRAEFAFDIQSFVKWHEEKQNAVVIQTVEVNCENQYEPTWTFRSNLDLFQLVDYFLSSPVPDLHYIYQSVKKYSMYDGERDNSYTQIALLTQSIVDDIIHANNTYY